MPEAIERKLKAKAAEHPTWSKKRKARYVYGTLNKIKEREAKERKPIRKRRGKKKK